jgi:hypothetical protein
VCVVLRRTADEDFGLYEMYKSAEGTLQQIEHQESDTPFLMAIERKIKERCDVSNYLVDGIEMN